MRGRVLAGGAGSHLHQVSQPYQNICVASPGIALLFLSTHLHSLSYAEQAFRPFDKLRTCLGLSTIIEVKRR